MRLKKRLTCTNEYATLQHWRAESDVDATAKKLVEKVNRLEDERFRINQEIHGIITALRAVGVNPTKYNAFPDAHETEYHMRQVFASTTLTQGCQRILQDHKDQWLTKSQIEYLIARGGYQFSAKDATNSVAVTLQRLANSGKCNVERVRGSLGNRYRWITRFPRNAEEKGEAVGS
jgi:hypothetical protein